MRFAVVGLTKGDEYDRAVAVFCRHQRIHPNDFCRGVHNVYDDRSKAEAAVAELSAQHNLKDCCWHVCSLADTQ